MSRQQRILSYASRTGEDVGTPWVLLLVSSAIVLACAGFYTAAYEGSEEPFFGPATGTDIFVFRIFPILLALGWPGWGVLVWLRVRSRVVALILCAAVLPFAAISGWVVLDTRANFEAQQRSVALWLQQPPPADEAEED